MTTRTKIGRGSKVAYVYPLTGNVILGWNKRLAGAKRYGLVLREGNKLGHLEVHDAVLPFSVEVHRTHLKAVRPDMRPVFNREGLIVRGGDEYDRFIDDAHRASLEAGQKMFWLDEGDGPSCYVCEEPHKRAGVWEVWIEWRGFGHSINPTHRYSLGRGRLRWCDVRRLIGK